MSPFFFLDYLQQSDLQHSSWQQLCEQHDVDTGSANEAVALMRQTANMKRAMTFFIEFS